MHHGTSSRKRVSCLLKVKMSCVLLVAEQEFVQPADDPVRRHDAGGGCGRAVPAGDTQDGAAHHHPGRGELGPAAEGGQEWG